MGVDGTDASPCCLTYHQHHYSMTDLDSVEDEPYDYTFEEALQDLIADFVTDKPYIGCLATLFRMPKGEWVSLEQLCKNVPSFPATIALYNLPSEIPQEVFVAWLDHPWNDESNDFVIITFYCDREMFNTVAIYNRHHFWEKYQEL